jgi:hypothetical protein
MLETTLIKKKVSLIFIFLCLFDLNSHSSSVVLTIVPKKVTKNNKNYISTVLLRRPPDRQATLTEPATTKHNPSRKFQCTKEKGSLWALYRSYLNLKLWHMIKLNYEHSGTYC